MTTQHKPMLIEDRKSRGMVRFMILTSWLSFVASAWLALFLSSDFFFLGAFWLSLTYTLAMILGAVKKQ